jgi:hypothetical protein
VTFRNISDRNTPVVYNYKVLTMSNNLVREEYSFTFPKLLDADEKSSKVKPKQMLVISRDLNKLMEVYGDSKCRIFKKISDGNKKFVEWELLHTIKKFPTSLQGESYANFLFSPNLNYFIDVAVTDEQFCIR